MRTRFPFGVEPDFSDLSIEELNKVTEKLNADEAFKKLPKEVQNDILSKVYAELGQKMVVKVVDEVSPPPEPKPKPTRKCNVKKV